MVRQDVGQESLFSRMNETGARVRASGANGGGEGRGGTSVQTPPEEGGKPWRPTTKRPSQSTDLT